MFLVWSWPVTEDSLVYVFIFPKVIYPLNDICLCCSIYSTIAVSYERFESNCLHEPGAIIMHLSQKCSTIVRYMYFIKFVFSFFHFFLLLLCIFRYSAVCNPYKYREKNMENMSSSFYKVLFLIISASVAINIPRFFETTIVHENLSSDSEKRNNSSFHFPWEFEDFSYTFEVTPLRTDPNYIR